MHTFQLKYGQSPGDIDFAETLWPDDSLFAGFNTNDGDNDGDLRVFSVNSGEHHGFFQHLKLAGMYAGVQTDYTTTNSVGGSIPESVFDGVGFYPVGYNRCGNQFEKDESLRVGTHNSGDNNVYTTWTDAVSVWLFDQKFDDGLPYEGIVVTQSNCQSGGVYETDSTTIDCGINYCLPDF